MLPDGSALDDFVEGFDASALSPWKALAPWEITNRSEAIVRQLFDSLSDDFDIHDEIAVHRNGQMMPRIIQKLVA